MVTAVSWVTGPPTCLLNVPPRSWRSRGQGEAIPSRELNTTFAKTSVQYSERHFNFGRTHRVGSSLW